MGNCCGARRCNCRVIAGTNVTIDGSGSSGSPYVISASGGTTALAVTDSPTVDLALTGTGEVGDPYTVTADVILDPAPPGGGSNLVQSGPDGLYLECQQVQSCLTAPAPPEVGCGLTGDGTTGAPIAANPIAGQEAWADTWDCPDTEFSTLKCDPATGALWTPPEHTSAVGSVRQEHFSAGPLTQGVTGWIIISDEIWAEGVYVAGSITTCRGVSFQSTFSGHAEISWTANATFELGYAVSIDGGPAAVRPMTSQLTGIAAGTRRTSFTTHQAANYPPMVGGSTRVYPAIRVVAGSVTINSWLTETLLAASTR